MGRIWNSPQAGIVLRYGWFYGPGTNYDPDDSIPGAIRKGRMPIVGTGAGTYFFISLRDSVLATMRTLQYGRSGLFNIVDDDPAPLREWLPIVARPLNAPEPTFMDESLAREKLGDMLMYVMNEQRGASNAKAKRELNWNPLTPSWRSGLAALYSR